MLVLVRFFLVMVVMVDDPHGGSYFGGDVAAPVFQEIAKFALQYYGVPPDAPRHGG